MWHLYVNLELVISILPINFLNYFTYFCVLFTCFTFPQLTVQYSVFGSLMTAGGIAGALVNGKIADVIGRRGVRFFGHPLVLFITLCRAFQNQKLYSIKFPRFFIFYLLNDYIHHFFIGLNFWIIGDLIWYQNKGFEFKS